MKPFLHQFYHDKCAVTSIEYALLASLIAVVVLVGVNSTGASVKLLYAFIKDHVVPALQ